MRISELAAREDHSVILAATLTRGWSGQYGKVSVGTVRLTGSQAWRAHPLLSVVTGPRPGAEARRFAMDAFRYTPVMWRGVPQWIAGTLAGSDLGFRIAARPLLWASPPIPDHEHLLVVPGNRRVRVFDFASQMCRVFLKTGYDATPIRNEVSVRGAPPKGPFPPIVAWDSEETWFEEPIVQGVALPRCPPRVDRARCQSEALRLLDSWLERTSVSAEARARGEALAAGIADAVGPLGDRLGPKIAARLPGTAIELANQSAEMGPIELARTHGDFQPGNVLVQAASGTVLLTDWEHTELRCRWYDALVWGLLARRPSGFQKRAARFLATSALWGGAGELLPRESRFRSWRRGALALFLLEEIAWIAEDVLSSPRSGLSVTEHAVLDLAEWFVRRVGGLP